MAKGKYAGKCPKCGFILIAGDEHCNRCGTEFKTPAVAQKHVFVLKEKECDCAEDCICKCDQNMYSF